MDTPPLLDVPPRRGESYLLLAAGLPIAKLFCVLRFVAAHFKVLVLLVCLVLGGRKVVCFCVRSVTSPRAVDAK